MKVLHIGFSNPALGNAFKKRCDYRFIDWTSWTAVPNNVPNLHKHILDTCDEFDPDVVFMQIQSPGVITPELCQQLPGLVVNWTWDYREPTPEWMVDCAPHVLSAFTNENDVNYLTSLGHRAVFLQGGFDSEIYNPDGMIDENAPSIVFMANNYPKDDYDFPLADFRMDIVQSLKERYGSEFAVYGFGWPGQNPLQSFMHRERKEAECYRGCKIAINLSHYQAERYTSDRMFRILGTGTFCLSHWYPGIDKDFKQSTHLDIWKTKQELFDLIDHYLANAEERIETAEAGCKLAHLNYTWDHMVYNIKKIYEHDRAKSFL